MVINKMTFRNSNRCNESSIQYTIRKQRTILKVDPHLTGNVKTIKMYWYVTLKRNSTAFTSQYVLFHRNAKNNGAFSYQCSEIIRVTLFKTNKHTSV